MNWSCISCNNPADVLVNNNTYPFCSSCWDKIEIYMAEHGYEPPPVTPIYRIQPAEQQDYRGMPTLNPWCQLRDMRRSLQQKQKKEKPQPKRLVRTMESPGFWTDKYVRMYLKTVKEWSDA